MRRSVVNLKKNNIPLGINSPLNNLKLNKLFILFIYFTKKKKVVLHFKLKFCLVKFHGGPAESTPGCTESAFVSCHYLCLHQILNKYSFTIYNIIKTDKIPFAYTSVKLWRLD